jgi:hypothetical protein
MSKSNSIPPRRYRIRLCELGWEVYMDSTDEEHPIPVVFHSMEQVVEWIGYNDTHYGKRQ